MDGEAIRYFFLLGFTCMMLPIVVLIIFMMIYISIIKFIH